MLGRVCNPATGGSSWLLNGLGNVFHIQLFAFSMSSCLKLGCLLGSSIVHLILSCLPFYAQLFEARVLATYHGKL